MFNLYVICYSEVILNLYASTPTPLSPDFTVPASASLVRYKIPVDVSSILTLSTFQKTNWDILDTFKRPLATLKKLKSENGSLQINLGGKPKVMFPQV
jgi:hypothetical protein